MIFTNFIRGAKLLIERRWIYLDSTLPKTKYSIGMVGNAKRSQIYECILNHCMVWLLLLYGILAYMLQHQKMV